MLPATRGLGVGCDGSGTPTFEALHFATTSRALEVLPPFFLDARDAASQVAAPMHLREILAVPRIDVALAAADKDAALAAMSRLLCEGVGGASDPALVARVLAEREAVGSTGVGSGVAIPHGRVPGLDHFVGALAICRKGIAFQSIDGEPVDVLFALVGPERAAGEHLKCLARIGRLLRDPAIRQCLRDSDGAESALGLVIAADGA